MRRKLLSLVAQVTLHLASERLDVEDVVSGRRLLEWYPPMGHASNGLTVKRALGSRWGASSGLHSSFGSSDAGHGEFLISCA